MRKLSASELDQLRDPSRDPVVTDGGKYKIVLENDRVRVLEYQTRRARESLLIIIQISSCVR